MKVHLCRLPFLRRGGKEMEYLVDHMMMKRIETETIEHIGIPSLVLMERAALAVVQTLEREYGRRQKVLCVCGMGNNGADGIAAARILWERDHQAAIYIPENSGGGTGEWKKQLSIAEELKIPVFRKAPVWNEYTVLVDGIFGIGLSRDIKGSIKDTIEAMNQSGIPVVAVDVPSGIHGGTGKEMGIAVKAAITVTFGYRKLGLVFYPGAACAGKICVENVGFPKSVIDKCEPHVYTYTRDELKKLPRRIPEGNKGTFGKIAVVAGTKNMAGAALFSAAAAYRMGAGMVRVLTCEENREILQRELPEAVLSVWKNDTIEEQAKQSMDWADVIVAGPGLGQSEEAERLVKCVLEYAAHHEEKPVILDADGLNLFAKMEANQEEWKGNLYLTPHVGELSRLTGRPVAELKAEPMQAAREYVRERNICLAAKDARTIVVSSQETSYYINTSGCAGMATAGSGDILSGILAGMLAMGLRGSRAAELAVYFHGLAGEAAAKKCSQHGMCASDLLEGICDVWKEIEE